MSREKMAYTVIGTLLVLIAGGIFTLKNKELEQKTFNNEPRVVRDHEKSGIEEKRILQQWDPIPLQDLPEIPAADSLTIPATIRSLPLPPFDILLTGKDCTPFKFMDRATELIRSHPMREVREDFYQEILCGRAQYTTPIRINTDAGFATIEGFPTIAISPHLLIVLEGKDDNVKWAWLMIFHEYVHYTQWKRSPEKAKAQFELNFEDSSQELCRVRWEGELEAYQKSADFALTLGEFQTSDPVVNEDLVSMIRSSLDPAAFKQWLFFHQARIAENAAPQCMQEYATLAGHPHPEAFEDPRW